MDFKVGDQVICIDASSSAGFLVKGKVYSVTKFVPHWFSDYPSFVVLDIPHYKTWYISRFQKINPMVLVQIKGLVSLLDKQAQNYVEIVSDHRVLYRFHRDVRELLAYLKQS